MSKTKAKLRKLEKKLHAKALKHQTQKTNAIRRKMATERENREYGAYIQKELGRKRGIRFDDWMRPHAVQA